jgi:hypothetical protein
MANKLLLCDVSNGLLPQRALLYCQSAALDVQELHQTHGAWFKASPCVLSNHGQTWGSRYCLAEIIVQAVQACKGSSSLQQLTVLCCWSAVLAT